MRPYIFVLLCLFACLSPSVAAAQLDLSCEGAGKLGDGDAVLAAVETRYQSIQDLSARFSQESFFLGLDEKKFSSGTIRFRKPGMMDWLYATPDPQRFVSDGKTLWFYQPDLKQVTIGEFQRSFNSELPVSFLLGLGKLQDNFRLKIGCELRSGTLLVLLPKAVDGSMNEFRLLVRKSDRSPLGAKIVDLGGNETTILFSEVVLNSNLPEKLFQFEVPKGTDILDQRTVQQALEGSGQ